MPKICESNQEESFTLDELFKEILARVKPYILALTCADTAQLCKFWLNKLHSASSQRHLRNEYLMELYRQLKTGHVGGIFYTLPPTGPLLPLPKSYHMVCISSSVSDFSDCMMRPTRSCMKSNARYMQHQESKALLKRHTMNMNQCLHSMKPLSTVQSHNQRMYNQKEFIWNKLQNQKNHDKTVDVSANIDYLNTNVSCLKAKFTEMEKFKESLEESCKQVVQEYHSTVMKQFVELKQQLKETRLKNEALDNNVNIISRRLEELYNGKGDSITLMDKIKMICERFESFAKEKNKELQLKQELLDKKDMESLKQDKERRAEIQMLLNKIYSLETKLEVKIRDEDMLHATLVQQYANIKEEFNRMRVEIEDKTQKQNEILSTRISTLRKAMEKLEKSKEKLEYEYERKLSYIIKNKDEEIKTLQLQLQEQRNELSSSLNTKIQNEVQNIASTLEKRYKKLLAETETLSENQTQEYLRKIAVLEEQIQKIMRN